MQAHFLSLHTPSIPGIGPKVKTFFLKVVMLPIKLTGMKRRAPCKQIDSMSLHTHSAFGLGQKVKTFFKVAMLHTKLKGMELRTPCKHTFCPYTHPQSLGWV